MYKETELKIYKEYSQELLRSTKLIYLVTKYEKYGEQILTIIKRLLNQKRHILNNVCCYNGDNALTLACKNIDTTSHIDVVKLLLSYDHINVNHMTRENINVLSILFEKEKYSLVKWIINNKRCHINNIHRWRHDKPGNGRTLLMYAIDNQKLDIIKLLIKKGCDINIQNYLGHNALMRICMGTENSNTLKMIKLLVYSGCDIKKQDNKGWNTLMHAIYNQYSKEVVDYLSKRSKRYYGKEKGWNIVQFIATKKSTIDKRKYLIVKYLLDNGYSINRRLIKKRTPLIHAVIYGYHNYKIAQLLIERGCNINARDKRGSTALIHATKNSNFTSSNKIIKLLLDNGANINIKNKSGITALMYAAIGSNNEIRFNNSCFADYLYRSKLSTVKMLIEHSADPELKNIQNRTFWHYLGEEYKSEIKELILEVRIRSLLLKSVYVVKRNMHEYKKYIPGLNRDVRKFFNL